MKSRLTSKTEKSELEILTERLIQIIRNNVGISSVCESDKQQSFGILFINQYQEPAKISYQRGQKFQVRDDFIWGSENIVLIKSSSGNSQLIPTRDLMVVYPNNLVRYFRQNIHLDENQDFSFNKTALDKHMDLRFGHNAGMLEKGIYRVSYPLKSRGPIKLKSQDVLSQIDLYLTETLTQNQQAISAGLINSVEIYFSNQGKIYDLFPALYSWLTRKMI